jgi:transcriptional regulator with XRE-family HTH domain
MPRHSCREHGSIFGQAMLTLRKSLRLTQAGLAHLLGVSRRAIGEWEGGLNYPREQHLQHVIELCVRASVFTPGREEEEIRACGKRPINGCSSMRPGSR